MRGLVLTSLQAALPRPFIMAIRLGSSHTLTSSVKLRTCQQYRFCANPSSHTALGLWHKQHLTHSAAGEQCVIMTSDVRPTMQQTMKQTRSLYSSPSQPCMLEVCNRGHTFEMCTPRRRWAPQQSMHIRMPRLRDAQSGSAAPQSAQSWLPGACPSPAAQFSCTACTGSRPQLIKQLATSSNSLTMIGTAENSCTAEVARGCA